MVRQVYQPHLRRPSSMIVLVPVLLATIWQLPVSSYKPVIIVHGLFDSPAEFKTMLDFIDKTHPGTNVTVVDLFDRRESLQPLWKQVQGFGQVIYPIMQNAADGVHLLCYSQGGLICRGLLETMPDHNVDTFISLSSPQMGQYGDTDYLRYLFPHYVKSNLYRFCYKHLGQTFSICNYWNDPHHHDLYLNNSDYLALLNSERSCPNTTVWKKNFLRLHKLVLIGGPDDGVITPWQSSQFGFYNEKETVMDMQQQKVYLQDVFGLKTLDARRGITRYTVPGVSHTTWHSNLTVYETYIEKFLT